MKNDVNCAAKLRDCCTVNQKDLGTRLSSEYKMVEHFTLFTRKKYIARAARKLDGRQLVFGEYIFAVLNNPLSPKLAYKQTIEDELNIDRGKAFGFRTYAQPHSIIANYDFENFFLALIGQLHDGVI